MRTKTSRTKVVGLITALSTVVVTAFNAPNAAAEDHQAILREAESIANAVANGELSEDSMTPRQIELFKGYTTPGELIVEKLPSNEYSSRSAISERSERYCRQDGSRFEQKALFGNTLYTFWQNVEICGLPGIDIDSVKVIDSGGETSTPTWSYNGEASPPVAYRVGDGWYARSSENFEPKIVFSGIGLGQRTECISADINRAGDYDSHRGC